MTFGKGNTEALEGQTGLEAAYQAAMEFTLQTARSQSAPIEDVRRRAEEEVTFGHVNVDESGVTSGMRLVVTEPASRVSAQWRHLKNRFETALHPFMADITAVESLRKEIADVEAKRDEKLKSLELELKQDPKFGNVEENYLRSKDRYTIFRDQHANRDAVMFAKKPYYWVVLALVLVTECFVNYHAFNAFWGVPAVALGTTLILGILLALAAHQHGELIKQWSYLFSRAKSPSDRAGSWRMFALSSSALAIVLGFTGWARWAAALEAMHSQGGGDSILGNVGVIQVNPVRDVLISLIANLGAWMVGVIISYAGHDRDPDYMDITKQYLKHLKIWERRRLKLKADREHAVASAAEKIKKKESAAETRGRSVKHQLDMLHQMSLHNQDIEREIGSATQANIDAYRDVVVRAANSGQAKLYVAQGGVTRPLSPADYQSMMPVLITAA